MIKRLLILIFWYTIAQNWESSFFAGSFDSNNNFMGGSEVLQLVPHKGKLYASVSYWQDESNIWYGGSNSNIGWSQIISLENPESSWVVDLDMGPYHLRPEVLKEVIFTKDLSGDLLPNPDTLLVAGAFSSNYFFGPVSANAFIRYDDNWIKTLIFEGSQPGQSESYSMRDMELFTDSVTGQEHLIVSVGTKGIFSGKYNPNAEGRISWDPVPEIGSLSTRPLGIAVANGVLYFSSGNKIYRRFDGENPTYSVVHDFSDLSSNINSAVGGIRGITKINHSGYESLLLMWCPDSQSKGLIFRLDPNLVGGFERVYETKLSLLVEDYLPGATVNYLLGAYNDFFQVYDYQNDEFYHIVGFESTIQGSNYPTWNGYYSGALFAKRDTNGEYTLEEIDGLIGPNDSPLVATRCYANSPFQNESAIYFGGFDPNGFLATNKAWIYKKIISLIGDLNLDGDINVLDAIQVVNYILINQYFINADINQDGLVNILDIVSLVNIILD